MIANNNISLHAAGKPFSLIQATIVLLALGTYLPAAQAATIDVTPGAIDTATNGNCSLVEAIQAANTDAAVDDCPQGSGADTLRLLAGSVFNFAEFNNVNVGNNALPAIHGEVTIQGNGAVIERHSASDTPAFRFFLVGSNGNLSLDQLTLQGGNQATGGAVYNLNGTLNISNSTLKGNTGNFGSAVYSASTTNIRNSTFSGNTINTGGVIENIGGNTVIEHSTITSNTAADLNGGSGVVSAGNSNAETRIRASIVSNNSNFDVRLRGGSTNSFVSEGNNLIGSGDTAVVDSFNQPGDQTNITDPKLSPLGHYGGVTQTHLPQPDSPAVDAVQGVCNGSDQRGAVRPPNSDPNTASQCDIGAVEYFAPIVVARDAVTNDDTDGICSLVEAINNANNTTNGQDNDDCNPGNPTGLDIITLPGGSVFSFSIGNNTGGGGEKVALPIVNSAILIQGNGAVIERSPLSGTPKFKFIEVGSGGNLSLDSLTLQNGNEFFGSAVRNNFGILSISNSTLQGNTAISSGGAVFSQTPSDSTTIITRISNSTLSGNTARFGGAIYNDGGTLLVEHSTVTNNTASSSGEGSGISSAGNNSAQTHIRASIVSGNTNNDDVSINGSPTNSFVSGGDNLIGGGDAIDAFDMYMNRIETNPRLSPLGHYGGVTQTHLPLPDSPAVDTVQGACNSSDQRGLARPQNGNPDTANQCDIGAVEYFAPIIVARDAVTDDDTDGICSLVEAINNANDTTNGQASSDCNPGNPTGLDIITLPAASVFGLSMVNNSHFLHGKNALPVVDSEIVMQGNGAVIERNPLSDTADFRFLEVIAGGNLSLDRLSLQNGGGFAGGAVRNSNGLLNISNSTLSGNTADFGGAVYSETPVGSITIITRISNSSLSGNTAGFGGAIYNDRGTAVVEHSTTTNNTATEPNGGSGVTSLSGSNTQTYIRASIVSGNANNDDLELRDISFNSFRSLGDNLIGGGNTTVVNSFNQAGDQRNVTNPKLSPLAHYGGVTQTHLPLPDSPVVDAMQGACNGSDQRGAARPQNGNPDTANRCDIGAVEYFAPIVVARDAVADDDTDGICSLVEAVKNANNTSDGQDNDDCNPGNPTGLDIITLPAASVFSFSDSNANGLGSTVALPLVNSEIVIQGNGAVVERSPLNDTPAFRLLQIISGGNLSLDSLTLQNGETQEGGAILNFNGFLSISNSTLSGNTSNNSGGAVYSVTPPNSTTIITRISNSTLSGNNSIFGGAILNHNGTTVIEHSTITNNTTNQSGSGSGIGSLGNEFTQTHIRASIVSGNADNDDVSIGNGSTNSFRSLGDNLVGGGNATAVFNELADQSGVTNPQLDALADTGGPTHTHRPQTGSPAIDAVQGRCSGTDQRGLPRPQNGAGTLACDIGAVEMLNMTLDTDSDGMTDFYEDLNGLDKNVDDAMGDLDGDGLTNLEEYNGGNDSTAANNPDTDGDGIGDNIDLMPLDASNDCGQDGMGNALFMTTAPTGEITQCAADNMIRYVQPADIQDNATLELYAPNVSFDPMTSVPNGSVLRVISGDPIPGSGN